jgi:glycosyltransferase involved in cell wall biosynthesis
VNKKITIVSPCYNEEENISDLYQQLLEVARSMPKYDWDFLFIDNASTDSTQDVLRKLAAQDPHVRCIFNTRNFGHMRSPYHAILQTHADATILMASDLQDPPSLLKSFVEKWEGGAKSVMAVKDKSEESILMYSVRSAYYNFINRLSDIELTKNATGFGLYDRCVVDALRQIPDHYPYFRGLISELGFSIAHVYFTQPTRKRGFTKNNFYTLYDIGMTGITSHSRIPLRVATISGFVMSAVSLVLAIGYFIAKLIFWNQFPIGMVPILIGLFFFSSVQLFFIGIIGEYIGSIYTQVLKRPLVIEKERINF